MCAEREVNPERSLTFEEFKKSLINLNLRYLPAAPETPKGAPKQSYKQVLQSKLLQSQRGFQQFLKIFVNKAIQPVSDQESQVAKPEAPTK